MKPMIALTNFELVLPAQKYDQTFALDYTAQLHSEAAAKQDLDGHRIALLMTRYGVKSMQIGSRYFENPEIVAKDSDILERMLFFGERAHQVFSKFYPIEKAAPNHIVHVTCTGYISPSPVQLLVNDNHWNEKTNTTHAYHMGCYAALPAVRMAEGFVAAGQKQVDIVHTEMCGLHMDKNDHSPEQMVVQTLFADGHIKYSAMPVGSVSQGFKVHSIKEQIVPDSAADMSWIPASWGMKMSLSREVPQKIGIHLRVFLQEMSLESDYDLAYLLKNAIFAIHPGGPKIIESVQKVLELTDTQTKASREILFERGNMSSATLPHVWKNLLDNNIPSGQLVVSLAFGPGLTIFGALFETV